MITLKNKLGLTFEELFDLFEIADKSLGEIVSLADECNEDRLYFVQSYLSIFNELVDMTNFNRKTKKNKGEKKNESNR